MVGLLQKKADVGGNTPTSEGQELKERSWRGGGGLCFERSLSTNICDSDLSSYGT